MSPLERISARHSDDLDRLNKRISTRLSSSNTLMSTVISSLLRTKGKQIRPLLTIMCAKLFAGVDERVLAAAAAIELLHNASLIHDDVVDNSPTRRGAATVNAVWDNHVAVLVGDYFTASSMHEAIGTGDLRIVDAICTLGRRLSLGEIDQICHAREHNIDEEAYYRIVDYKTASLFVSAARVGCLASGADDKSREALEAFALLFGRCFQLRDDVFDFYSSDTVGKPTGNDLREGKISLPLIKALEHSEASDRNVVVSLLERDILTDAEIDFIQHFARSNGGIEQAYEAMQQLRHKAEECLKTLGDNPVCDELLELFDFVISRQF